MKSFRSSLFTLIFFSFNLLATNSVDVTNDKAIDKNIEHENSIKVEKKDEANPLSNFLMAEVLLATNAWMAAESPNAYGVLGALVFPIAGCGDSNKITCGTTLIGFESLAIYNISIDKNKKSKNKIFKENMIAWHIVIGLVTFTEYLTEDKTTELSFKPAPNGGQLQFTYRF